MTKFNDTVRVSELPEAENLEDLRVLGVDGTGRSVQAQIGPTLHSVGSNKEKIDRVAAQVAAMGGASPLEISLDREAATGGIGKVNGFVKEGFKKGGEVINVGDLKQTVDLPERYTVRISHIAAEGNSGKRQRLEWSKDGGKTWNVFEPTGEATLSPELEAQKAAMLKELRESGVAYPEGPSAPEEGFHSEQEVMAYFDEKRDERVDIELAAAEKLLVRGKSDTLEGFNIRTLPTTTKVIPLSMTERYQKDKALISTTVSPDSTVYAIFYEKSGYPFFSHKDIFGNRAAAEANAKELIKDSRWWVVADTEEFEKMWEEYKTEAETPVPFVCGGDLLSLLDWENPDAEAARGVARVMCGLFAGSAIAVSPELPDILGDGTYSRMFAGCECLREVRAQFGLKAWLDIAADGLDENFPTYRWLPYQPVNFGSRGTLVVRYDASVTDESIEDLLEDLDEPGNVSTFGTFKHSFLPTEEYMGAMVAKMVKGFDNLPSMVDSKIERARWQNFTLPAISYNPATGELEWNTQDSHAGCIGASQDVTIQSLRLWFCREGGMMTNPFSVQYDSGFYQFAQLGADQVYAIAEGDNANGVHVESAPWLVWDKRLEPKSPVKFVTAAELAAAISGEGIESAHIYFVTDAGNRSLSIGMSTNSVQTIWQEQA